MTKLDIAIEDIKNRKPSTCLVITFKFLSLKGTGHALTEGAVNMFVGKRFVSIMLTKEQMFKAVRYCIENKIVYNID